VSVVAADARIGKSAGPAARTQHRASEIGLLAVSLLLCGWLDRRALVLVLAVATSDFLIARRLATAAGPGVRRVLLGASVTIDVGLLLFWRAAGIWRELAGASWMASDGISIVVPVGLSFFTLRSLGFVIDVYRRAAVPCTTWTRHAAFLCFFPAFVAGPISRGSQLLPQLEDGVRVRWSGVVDGVSIIAQGLAKKMLIADRLATVADPIFADPGLYPPWTVAAGVLAYSLQIFCDFSGYSDVAIGAARVIGIDLPRNFTMPYLSGDIVEFWRRWHITLSTWLRDYVFLPLAYVGSRRVEALGVTRRQGELLNYGAVSVLTMLVAGVWHGAGLGFLVWGGAHGFALAAHRVWQGGGRRKRRMPAWLGRALTFTFVSLAWVPFRAEGLGDAGRVYASLLGLGAQRTYPWYPSWLPICAGAVVLGHIVTRRYIAPAGQARPSRGARVLSALGLTAAQWPLAGAYLVPVRVTVIGTFLMTLFVATIFLFAPSQVGPFVYAAF
jgi:alginate O-acetyltransferase complex protein AlgI